MMPAIHTVRLLVDVLDNIPGSLLYCPVLHHGILCMLRYSVLTVGLASAFDC